jgi:hypothetical protein
MNGLPQFLVIGAQKAGTSWLHHHLRRHPGVFMPEAKDQGYFCWCEGPQALTLEQYLQVFEPAAEDQLVGEATAAYFWTDSGSAWGAKPAGYCPDVPKRVLDTLGGETRLILSLRDPVERAVSAYLHHIAFGDLDPAVSLLDAGDFIGLLDIGFYAAHLENWLRYFPLQQFLVLDFEQDIQGQPRVALRRVFEFLEVDPAWQANLPEHPVFEGRERLWLEGEVWVPATQYPGAPPGQRKEIKGRSWCRRVNRSTIERLRGIYAADQDRLKMLLG